LDLLKSIATDVRSCFQSSVRFKR